MKRMIMNGLHLGEKLRNILHASKRTEKEQNAGKTNPAQCPIEEKQDMTDEEVLDFLIPKMLKCMKKKIDPLPEQGKFDSHSVSITYPGSTCEAYLNYTYDPIDGGDKNRRLRVAMRRQDSDRAVSIYLFKGSKAECLAWLEQPGLPEILKENYADLYTSVKEEESMKLTLEEAQNRMNENHGNLDLHGMDITALPEGLKVGGNLDLSNTPITALPEGLTVGGDLDLSGTQITTLPEGLTVGGKSFAEKIGAVHMKKLLEKLFKNRKGKSLETRLEHLSDTDLRGIPGYLIYPNDPLSQIMFGSKMQEVCDRIGVRNPKQKINFIKLS